MKHQKYTSSSGQHCDLKWPSLTCFKLYIDGDCGIYGNDRNYNNGDYNTAEFILLWESLQIQVTVNSVFNNVLKI